MNLAHHARYVPAPRPPPLRTAALAVVSIGHTAKLSTRQARFWTAAARICERRASRCARRAPTHALAASMAYVTCPISKHLHC